MPEYLTSAPRYAPQEHEATLDGDVYVAFGVVIVLIVGYTYGIITATRWWFCG